MASVAQYGGITFQDNEVNLVTVSSVAKYSDRNRRLQHLVTMQCFGEIQLDTVANIISRANSYDAGLKVNGLDFRYTVGGTLAHAMLNGSDCISGTRVVQRSFPKGDGTELANRRSFSFTVQALYDAIDDDLVSWQETVETIGDGGPRFFILEDAVGGPPVRIITAIRTIVTYRQSGMAVGYSAYPTPPSAGAGGSGILTPASRITKMSARQMGNGLRFYPIKWSYLMYNDPSTYGVPDIQPVSK